MLSNVTLSSFGKKQMSLCQVSNMQEPLEKKSRFYSHIYIIIHNMGNGIKQKKGNYYINIARLKFIK